MTDQDHKPQGSRQKPQNQTSVEHGTVTSTQLEQQAERADLARGSETETRRAASQRR